MELQLRQYFDTRSKPLCSPHKARTVFPHFCPRNQNLAHVRTRGLRGCAFFCVRVCNKKKGVRRSQQKEKSRQVTPFFHVTANANKSMDLISSSPFWGP